MRLTQQNGGEVGKRSKRPILYPQSFKNKVTPQQGQRTWSPWCVPCHMAWEEEGLGFSRPSQQRLSFSFYDSGLHLLKNDFTVFLGKEGVPGGNSKAQPMCLVLILQPVNMLFGVG